MVGGARGTGVYIQCGPHGASHNIAYPNKRNAHCGGSLGHVACWPSCYNYLIKVIGGISLGISNFKSRSKLFGTTVHIAANLKKFSFLLLSSTNRQSLCNGKLFFYGQKLKTSKNVDFFYLKKEKNDRLLERIVFSEFFTISVRERFLI